jgi:hypothetical protein
LSRQEFRKASQSLIHTPIALPLSLSKRELCTLRQAQGERKG